MFSWMWKSLWDWSPLWIIVVCYAIVNYILEAVALYRKKPLPGPWGVPFLGYLPFLTASPAVKLYELSKKYGDVFGIKLLGNGCMVLNSYDAIKEAFVNRGLDFTGVPEKFTVVHWISDSKSIFVAEGEEWSVHRRFLLQTLRDLGMGKNNLVERIEDISQDLLEEFSSQNGAPFDPHNTFYNCSTNVICSLLFNKHYKKNDQEFQDLISHTRKLTDIFEGPEILLAQGNLFYLSSAYRALRQTKQFLYKLIRKFMKDHQENLDELNPQDYLDTCLLKMASIEKDTTSYHTEQNTIGNSVTLFLAGTETLTATMYWFLAYMMMYPDIQKKVQSELDHVVGRGRTPTWSDKSSLPFTEAVLLEMQRMGSIVPIAPMHCNAEEKEFRGFNIPERTHIIANLWAANRDPKYWSRPEEFDPTRFLDADGKFAPREAVVSFSIGKRSCAGESLARMEMFLFFTCVMHQFKICPPVGMAPSFNSKTGSLRKPLPYKLRAIPRL